MKPLCTLLLGVGAMICLAEPAVRARTVTEEWNAGKFPAPPPVDGIPAGDVFPDRGGWE